MDEIGFMMGLITSEKVIEIVRYPRKETGKLWYTQDGNREMVTVMECICADGTVLPPTIIYKAVGDVDQAWLAKEPWELPGALYGSSPNGWTSNRIGLEWLQRNFGPRSTTAIKAGGKRRLLLLDGHISHVNGNFLHYCLDNNVVLACLPPHTTHKLQPCDKGIFGPYKGGYSRELKDRSEANEYGVGKKNFASILEVARRQAFSPENIKSAFRSTGIWPPNRGKILAEIEQHTRARGKELPCSPGYTPLPHTANRPVAATAPIPLALSRHPPPTRLLDLDLEAVEALPIPQNPSELRTRREGLLQCMREVGVDNRTFRIQLEVKKFAQSAEKQMLEKAESDRRVAELEKENWELKEPKRATRRGGPVPETGFLLGSREDFDRIAGEKQRQKLSEKREKVARTRAGVSSLQGRITETVRKKENAREMEEKNRLPKRWKSSAALSEEETTLHARLHSVRQDLINQERELAEDERQAAASGILDLSAVEAALTDTEASMEAGDPGALGG